LFVFWESDKKELKSTLDTAYKSASLGLSFRQTNTIEVDGTVELLDMHICVMPNEKYEFITKDLAKTTAEQRCFISGVSHHPGSIFKSIVVEEVT